VSRSEAHAREPEPERPPRDSVTLALVGPTASGKTQVSLEVAPGLRAEVVSLDSMQIYRGMDVGTAKPTADERRGVPHHMLDVADPARPYSVASFQSMARAAADGILARGRRPMFVGGSGLYYRAVVDELDFPPTNAALRAQIERRDQNELLARLRERDPEAAARIEPANVRRVVRALEVIELTGRRFSEFRTAWDSYKSRYDLVVAGIKLSPAMLGERIAARVDRMIENGLADEVRTLLDRGLRTSLTAARAIAYPEMVAHLDGAITLDEARGQIVRSTRRFARRQMSWFRADPRIEWFDGADSRRAAEEIRAYYERAIERRTVGA
jgi:tRNA dimethylallyltransferase